MCFLFLLVDGRFSQLEYDHYFHTVSVDATCSVWIVAVQGSVNFDQAEFVKNAINIGMKWPESYVHSGILLFN